MTESTDVLKALRESRAKLAAATEGLTQAQAAIKPSPEKWSVLECVEHIVLAERRIRGWAENPQEGEAPPANPQKEAELMEAMAVRATRRQSPEPARPNGRYTTLAEALREFEKERAHSIAFVEKQGPGLYTRRATHPFFGAINGAETICLMAAHSERHAAQIREVRAAIESPASEEKP
jgi:uncharacterized damage-inducible protein DinB